MNLTKQIFLIFMQLEMFQVLHGWLILPAQAHVAVEHSVGYSPNHKLQFYTQLPYCEPCWIFGYTEKDAVDEGMM